MDIEQKIIPWQAKLALAQLKKLEKPAGLIRDYYYVNNRVQVLAELRAAGYYFDSLWYERPISPERYYKLADFPEEKCPEAVRVAREIVNVPKYYSAAELKPALNIIRKHEAKEANAK